MFNHPKGLAVLLSVELWERFSYYGMRALLMLYMVHELGFDTRDAGMIYGLYTALAYLTPIVGGVWADRVVGQRRAMHLGAVLMTLGHLAMIVQSLTTFVVALALVVLGTGLFKANSAVLVGQLYKDGDRRRDAGFALFYLTVNVGAVLAPLVCGTLARQGRWHWGFAAAGLGMALGLIAFRRYAYLLGDVGLAPQQQHKPCGARLPLDTQERRRIVALMLLALVGNVVLWTALSQNGSSLALLADRDTNLHISGLNIELPPSLLQAVNPLCILLGVPIAGAAWRALSRRNLEPSGFGKFAVGMLLVSVAFATLVVAGSRIDAGDKVSMLWLVFTQVTATAGELCASPVGLSLVSELSPKRYASALMGLWYASMALANWLGGYLAGLYDDLGKAQLFGIFAALTALGGIALGLLVRPLERLVATEDER